MTEYINAFELVLLGLALTVSRAKYTPFVLVCYNLWVQIVEWLGDVRFSHLESYYATGIYSYEQVNNGLMMIYLQLGFTCSVFGIVALCIKTRLSYLAGLVILIQSALQLIVGIAIYLEVYLSWDTSIIYSVHFIVDKLFVTLYVLIAWMCVYWSRKTGNL